MAAPIITIYKNGDSHFSGKKLVVNFKQIRNFDNFLDKVTQDTQAGNAIRSIRTPNHGSRVSTLENIKNGGAYVAVGLERFKQLHYTEIQSNRFTVLHQPKYQAKNVKPILHSKVYASARYRKVAVADTLKNRIVFVFQNGEERIPSIKLLLDKWVLQSMDKVLQHITYKVNLRTGAVRSLYTVDGMEIKEPKDIETAHKYVAVGYGRPFIRLPYAEVGVTSFTPRKLNESKNSSNSSESSPKYLFPRKAKLKLKKYAAHEIDESTKTLQKRGKHIQQEGKKEAESFVDHNNSSSDNEQESFLQQITHTIENNYEKHSSMRIEQELPNFDTNVDHEKGHNDQVSNDTNNIEKVTLLQNEETYDSIKLNMKEKVQGFGSVFEREVSSDLKASFKTKKEKSKQRKSLSSPDDMSESIAPPDKDIKDHSANDKIDNKTIPKRVLLKKGKVVVKKNSTVNKDTIDDIPKRDSIKLVSSTDLNVASETMLQPSESVSGAPSSDPPLRDDDLNKVNPESPDVSNEDKDKKDNIIKDVVGVRESILSDDELLDSHNTTKQANKSKGFDYAPTKKAKEEDSQDTADLHDETENQNDVSLFNATGKQQEKANAIKDNQETSVEKTIDMVAAEEIEDEEVVGEVEDKAKVTENKE